MLFPPQFLSVVMPAMTSADRSVYIAYIDGMRALAVLAVMAYHLDPQLIPGGFVGVDVFLSFRVLW